MKFLKKENIICFILLFIEIILLALSVGIEFYHLYSKSMDISYAVGTTSALASVFGAFAWIVILLILRFTKVKKGRFSGILLIIISISIGLAAHYQKPKLLYVDTAGGSCQVLDKGHDFIGYYLDLEITEAESNYFNEKGKFYCTKERYEELQVDEIYYTELLFNPNINLGTLRHINY